MKKTLAALFVAAAATVGAFSAQAQDTRIIVVSHGQANDPFWSVVKNGVTKAAEDMKVSVDYRAPETFDMVAMSQLIDAAVNQKPAGLIVSIPDASALGPAIKKAVAAGIPVISMNSGSDVSKSLGALLHVGQDELDAGKAAAPVLLGRAYFGAQPDYAACVDWIAAGLGGAAFVGHLLPVFAGFRGGKGVASALGCFLALEPTAALLGAGVYVLAYLLTRISSVGSLSAVISFPLWLYLLHARASSYALALGLTLLIIVRHRSNLQRLWARKEGRV